MPLAPRTQDGLIRYRAGEPFAYPLPNIIANLNGVSDPANGPENTINGSGLNEADEHSTLSGDMWPATPGAEPPQLAYEFDGIYKLDEILIWNYNVQFELILGFGLQDVAVEYSEDGANWAALGDVQFAQATASFELYGANDGIDGPYTLIANGDIVDFTGATAWLRFTKNETPIAFDNDVAYAHYPVLFPTVRDPGAANSMQIAEVELLGSIAP